MADSTLEAIIKKVRRLTRSPSVAQMSDDDIKEYVDTFVLYDFPEHLRLFTFKTTFTFYTEPNIDVYLPTMAAPLLDFDQTYTTFHLPVYVAGYETAFSQSRTEFFRTYPITNSIASIGTTGDGVTTNFTGTLSSTPVLRNNVLFSSVDINGAGLELHDDGAEVLAGDGAGTINYTTGAYTLAFTVAPADGQAINSQTVPYVAARPQSILYFDNSFTVRPVPDQPYTVTMDAFMRPSAFLALPGGLAESPELEQWWQYISYGAAKKVFEDRSDHESVAMIMPEFKTQESLVLRRTIVQQSKERVATIYTGNTAGKYGSGWFDGGGNF